MKLSDLTQQAGEWLRGSGPMSEIVISSRIRLARNLAGFPFLARCTRHQRQAVEHKVRDTILGAQIAPKTLYLDLDGASELDRQFLVERHLISKPHAAAEGARGVAIGENETVSIMVNERTPSACRSSVAAFSSKRPGTRSRGLTTSSNRDSTGPSTRASAT